MTTAFDTADEAAIQQCEERLRSAMLRSDVEALDVLLANDLIFIDHQGRRIEKAQDLEAHRIELSTRFIIIALHQLLHVTVRDRRVNLGLRI